MKTMKRPLALFLALLCFFSALSVTGFAATKYKSYDGKYGLMIPVKSNYKTECELYKINNDKGALSFSFKSKGHTENVYFGLTIYKDEERQEIIINKSGAFPAVDSNGTMNIDFSTLESGRYYGLTFTYVKKGDSLIVDSDSIYQFDIKLNKLGEVTPEITEAEALYTGNYLNWDTVEYADSYRVYRKQTDEAWKKLADVKKSEYIDESAQRGENYIYTVRAVDNGAYSKYNKNGVELVYLAAPEFSKSPKVLSNNRIKIYWNKVDGAQKYRIYRKIAGENYVRLATVDSDELEYIDKTAKTDGVTYYYAVKAISGINSGVLSEKAKIKLFGIQKPEVYCEGETVTVKWDKIKGATNYKLFKRTVKGDWEEVYSGTQNKFTDSDVSIGKQYYYSVTVEKDNHYSSFDTAGVSVVCLKEPEIVSVSSNVDNSVLVKWGAVKHATKYRIYRESPFEDSTYIGTTSSAYFYDTGKKANNYFYTYSVKAINENSESISGNNTEMHLFMEAPELVSVKWNEGNVVKWKRVAGALSYKIYRKVPDGSYKEIAEVKDVLSYKDKTAKKGTAYYYTVVAMNGDYKGSYENGIGINCLNAPEITSVALNKKKQVVVKWDEVSGATGYYVYRKTKDGSWKNLGKTSSLTYVDKTERKSNVQYFYTVRAYNSKGKGLYNKFGKSL